MKEEWEYLIDSVDGDGIEGVCSSIISSGHCFASSARCEKLLFCVSIKVRFMRTTPTPKPTFTKPKELYADKPNPIF